MIQPLVDKCTPLFSVLINLKYFLTLSCASPLFLLPYLLDDLLLGRLGNSRGAMILWALFHTELIDFGRCASFQWILTVTQ